MCWCLQHITIGVELSHILLPRGWIPLAKPQRAQSLRQRITDNAYSYLTKTRKTLAVMIPSRKAAKSAKAKLTNHEECVFLSDKNKQNPCRNDSLSQSRKERKVCANESQTMRIPIWQKQEKPLPWCKGCALCFFPVPTCFEASFGPSAPERNSLRSSGLHHGKENQEKQLTPNGVLHLHRIYLHHTAILCKKWYMQHTDN